MILCMRIVKILLGILLFSSQLKAQRISTVFVDSLRIVLDGMVICDKSSTFLRFLPSDRNTILKVFDDGNYQLDLEFLSYVIGDYSYLQPPDMKFYKDDVLQALATDAARISGRESVCSGTNNFRFRATPIRKDTNKNGTEILLRFRYFGFAPKDTSNYTFNYKQGEWIGFYNGMKEVTINYTLGKKNGPAQIIYNDGTIYRANFIDDIDANFDRGTLERNKAFTKYVIPNIVSFECQNYAKSFYLRNRSVNHYIDRNDKLTVNFKKQIDKVDVEYYLQGSLAGIVNDTMIIRGEEYEVRDFHKRNAKSMKYSHKSTLQKIPVKNIDLIKKSRPVFQSFVITTTLLALVSAVVVSPVISMKKNGFSTNKFLKVSGVSLGIATLSVTFGVVFGSKKFATNDSSKKNTWRIIPNR